MLQRRGNVLLMSLCMQTEAVTSHYCKGRYWFSYSSLLGWNCAPEIQPDRCCSRTMQSEHMDQSGRMKLDETNLKDLGGFLYLYSMPLRNMMKGNLTILTVVGACLVHYLRSAARPNLIEFAWPYLDYAWSHQPPTKLSTLMNCCSRWSTLFSHCIGDALR